MAQYGRASKIDLPASITGTQNPVDESEVKEKENFPFEEQEEIQELPF